MTPFLRQVAEVYYNRLGNRIADCCFVFPNRRAGLFFQHYLSEITTHPILSPEITSISDFFTKFSPLNLTDRISLLFYLYKAYKEVFGKEESFDEFVSWGDMILNDFNDIDKHLADAKKIYSLILDEKKIEQEFDYLTPEQREILHKFWKGFILSKDKPYRKKFIKMWELLYPLYERFREILLEDNRAYEGMLVRSVAENNRMDWSKVPFERAVFVGLNALTKAERQLMLSLGREGKADFYWDTQSPKIQDIRNRASLFILRNQKMFPSLYKLEQEELEEPEVTLIGVPSLNGQVKQIYPILQKLFTGIAGKALQTAVVLPDEQLLLPLLHSIPPCYEDINITMGYPLKNTQTIVLINYLMELQQLKRNIEGEQKFYFQPVLKLLSHPYLHLLCHEEIEKILREIKKKNHFFLSPKELSIHTALRKVFLPLEENENPAEYLIAIIEEIVSTFLHTASSQETENQPPMQGKEIEMESLHSSLLLLRHIKELGEQFSFEMRTNTWFSLIKRLVSSESISYEGEPLDGLQIMGILETRSLDFENLIIPSMNEGLFPSKSFSNSFIPNNLREAWELPTYKYQDSVWTYHFYRLISRAKHIFLLYNTSIGSTKGSEVSRFVQQLRYLYKVPIREERPSFPTLLKEESPLLVQKDEEVMKLLQPFLTPGSKKGISATAINDYLDCPLRFYLSYVLEIKEDKEIEEIIEEDIFGTIFHKVMEEIYGLMKKKEVSKEWLKNISRNDTILTRFIEQAFEEVYFNRQGKTQLKGNNFLVGELIRDYVKQTLEEDTQWDRFFYKDSEYNIRCCFPLKKTPNMRVNLKGFIDRIDEVNGKTRIVDYKSGKVDLNTTSIEDLFSMGKERKKAILQVLFYALLYAQETGKEDIQPTIYSLRKLYKDFSSKISIDGKEVESFSTCREEFTSLLQSCLEDIFDPTIPFVATTNANQCKFCFFKGKCCNGVGRG